MPLVFPRGGAPIRVTLPVSRPPSITPLQGWRMILQRLWEMEMGTFFGGGYLPVGRQNALCSAPLSS